MDTPRVLSCVLCQQRKVKCDRSFPCTNCIRSNAQCVPAGSLPRQRKRRFPERQLLDRLRQYESLLQQNDIAFDPLHGDRPREGRDPVDESKALSRPSPARSMSSAGQYETRNFWEAMNQARPESDEDGEPPPTMSEDVVRKVWDQHFEQSDPLFGERNTSVDFCTLHPEPSQIFRLWQIYLDNVDPLLKVTHTPTLQARIVEAIASLKTVDPVLQALMFGIYCMAVLSLMPDECEALLGSSRDDTLAHYQRSCRLALIHCGFLRSDDRECLTAHFFYLMALRPTVGDPRPLSSMLGIAMRTAQRIGLDSETSCARFPTLEAELRRRLWWTMVLFDSRQSEMADYRNTTLTPLWDCAVPINVNDLDLRSDMKQAPKAQGPSSEALFVVVRAEMANYIRNCSCQLDFTYPLLKKTAREAEGRSEHDAHETDALERRVEYEYLRFCDPDNPLHFVTTWMARGWLAKCRLFDYFSKYSAGEQTKTERDAAITHALAMLESDTKILLFQPASRYLWLVHFYFPFPAYIHILQDLRRRPLGSRTEQCWDLMGENFDARAKLLRRMSPRPLFGSLTSIIFQAWETTESALRQSGQPAQTPKVVSILREMTAENNALVESGKSMNIPGVNDQTSSWSSAQLPVIGDQYTSEPWMPFDLPGQIADDGTFTSSYWSLINWGM